MKPKPKNTKHHRRTLCLSPEAEAALTKLAPKNVSALLSKLAVIGADAVERAVQVIDDMPCVRSRAVIRAIAIAHQHEARAEIIGREALQLARFESDDMAKLWLAATNVLGALLPLSKMVEDQTAALLAKSVTLDKARRSQR